MQMATVTLTQASKEQRKPARGSKFASRRAFEIWLGSLPLANTNAAGKGLLRAVQELNQVRISAALRMHILEALSEPVGAVVAILDKQFHDTTFPLAEKKHKIGRLAITFYRELARGYRLCADQWAKHKATVSLLHRRHACLCIHRALSALEQLLVRACLLYQPLAEDLWNEIHSLYAFARHNGLHQRGAKDSLGWAKKEFTVEDVYKRIALLGICDPCRLDQGAIKRVCRAVDLWASYCNVADGQEPCEINAGQFEITLDGGYPPRLIADSADLDAGRDLIFNLAPLQRWLRGIVNQSDDLLREIPLKVEGYEAIILDAMLLRQLVATWGVRLERRYQRLPAQHEVSLIAGINGIHFTIGGEQSFAQFLETLDDPCLLKPASKPGKARSHTDQFFRPPMHQGEVINQSLGGYCLRLHKTSQLSLRVGELVGVCASSLVKEDAVWMLGAVRWLHAIGPDELEIGVSIMGQSVRAAGLISRLPHHDLPSSRGLMISDFSTQQNQLEYLVVPASCAALEGAVHIAWKEGQEHSAGEFDLTGVVEKTTQFCCFSYISRTPAYDNDPLALPEQPADELPARSQIQA